MAAPASLAPRAARSAQPKSKTDDSLLKSIGRTSLSGLSAVGNFLDLALGGSSVRDVLAGENPFDQFLTPFSDENRVGGRELLERYGVLRKNREGLDAGDVAGFVAEVALDPGSWVTGAGTLKALGKGGTVLSKASKLPKSLSRVQRMTTKVGDLAKQIPGAALETAATRSGFASGADFLSRHGSESVGGLVGLGVPFRSPSKVLGTGATAQKIGGALDKVGKAVRYGKIPGTAISPGQQLSRVFSSDAMGLHTPEIAQRVTELPGTREKIITGTRGDIAKDVSALAKAGALDDETSTLGRMFGEGALVTSKLTPEAQQKLKAVSPIAQRLRADFDVLKRKSLQAGVRLDQFADPAGIGYMPRQFVEMIQNYANSLPREQYLRGITEGTELLRRIIADPKVIEAPSIEDAVRYIDETYGHQIKTAAPPTVTATAAKLVEKPLGIAQGLSPEAMRAATGLPTVTVTNPSAIPQGLKPDALQNLIRERGSIHRSATPGVHGKDVSGGIGGIKPQMTVKGGAPRKMGPREIITETPGSVSSSGRSISGANRESLLQELAHRIRNVYTPEQRAVGGFGRNFLVDAQDAKIGMEWKLARANALTDALADVAKPVTKLDVPGDTRTVGEIFGLADLEATTTIERADDVSGVLTQPRSVKPGVGQEVTAGALVELARKMGMSPTPENLDTISRMHVPIDQADDLVRLMKGDDIKNVAGPLLQMFDAATNFFKVSVLNWPSRYSRDFTSSQAMNILTGNFSPRAFSELHKMVAGGVGDFTDIPIVQQMLSEQGLEATAENSTEMMRQLFYTYEKHTAVAGTHGTSEIVGDLSGGIPGTTKAFAAEFPGRDPLSPLSPSTLNAGAPVKSLAAWNPLNVRGVGGRLQSGAKLPAMGERLGRYTDTMGRGVAFVTNLKRGVAPEDASRIADALQVNYAPRSFTAAERKYLKRAFPFYSFASRMLPEVTKQLLEHPGGGIAQSIRAANTMRDDSTGPVPEYVSKGLAIPLGKTETGDNRYLTALDFMHEAPLNIGQFKNGLPDAGGTLRNVGSMLSPYIKGPLELAFNKTLFQNRELDEADPTIGRLLTNVGLRDEALSGRARPFISTGVEQLAANSPAARLFSSLRTATDKRKGISERAINLLTGARITDVSPRVQRGILIDELSDLMKAEGAQAMSTIRFRKAEIAETRKTNPALADRMEMLNREANKLLASAKSDAKKAKVKRPG